MFPGRITFITDFAENYEITKILTIVLCENLNDEEMYGDDTNDVNYGL